MTNIDLKEFIKTHKLKTKDILKHLLEETGIGSERIFFYWKSGNKPIPLYVENSLKRMVKK